MCPITKSAKKALRQSKKRAQRNLEIKRAYKDVVKKINDLVNENKIEEAKKLLPGAYKAIDKAVKTNILKKNTGSRKKSTLARLLSKSKGRK